VSISHPHSKKKNFVAEGLLWATAIPPVTYPKYWWFYITSQIFGVVYHFVVSCKKFCMDLLFCHHFFHSALTSERLCTVEGSILHKSFFKDIYYIPRCLLVTRFGCALLWAAPNHNLNNYWWPVSSPLSGGNLTGHILEVGTSSCHVLAMAHTKQV
jgi:hypothetical protein